MRRCVRRVTLFVTCIVSTASINGMTIPETFTPEWLSDLPSEITAVNGCFTGKETAGKGLQCLVNAFGLLPSAKTGISGQESPSKVGKLMQRHENEAELVRKKKGSSFKEGTLHLQEGYRKRKRKTNLMIPAAVGLGAVIMTAIVGIVGLIAGKALAMSFLAFIMTIALSTKAIAPHQRSTVVKENIGDALADIGQHLVADTDLPIDAIVHSSLRRSYV